MQCLLDACPSIFSSDLSSLQCGIRRRGGRKPGVTENPEHGVFLGGCRGVDWVAVSVPGGAA